MARKSILIFLTTLATLNILLWAVSIFVAPVSFRIGGRERAIVAEADGGRFEIACFDVYLSGSFRKSPRDLHTDIAAFQSRSLWSRRYAYHPRLFESLYFFQFEYRNNFHPYPAFASLAMLLGFHAWLAQVLFSAYPMAHIVRGQILRYRRQHRRKHNQCVQCGYDLTGLAERRCPECGQPL